MAESIITDSSSYSEDFEESFEEYSEEEADLRGYQEADVFPQLFNYLEASLAEDAFVNYRAQETPTQLAVGLFLARAKLSKFDFANKIRWEYAKKRELLLKSAKLEPAGSALPKALKSILCQMRVENDFIARSVKRKIKIVTDEVRSQTFVNLAVLVKDARQAEAMLRNERTAIVKKSEDLEDQFVWKRFYELLKTLVPSKILLSAPPEKQRAEIRGVVEGLNQMGLGVKNVVALEDAEYLAALGNKRFVARDERKMEISEVCSDPSRVQELLSMLLTFAKRPARVKSLNSKLQKGFLNRALIDLQRPTCEESLSQYLFVLEAHSNISKFQSLDFTSVEEDISPRISIQEVQKYQLSGPRASIWVQNQEINLRAATVEDLSCLPGSPIAQQPKSASPLLTLYQDSFYKCSSKRSTFIRSISSSECEELFSVYFYKNSEKRVHPDCFPDPSRPSFKYKYVVIKDVIVVNSGIFSKHWLVQLVPLKPAELKKPLNDFFLPRICKWEACMSSLVEEAHLTQMATEFSSLTNKVKLISKKGLNPLKKLRTASEAIVIPDLCIFHNNLRSIMRNEGLITKKLIYDHSIELWKASQAGLNWQEELSESNKLSRLCSGAVKKAFGEYLAGFCEAMASKVPDEEGFDSHKDQVLGQVESLKKLVEVEAMCTRDLGKILNSGASSSYLKYALTCIQDAVGLQTSSKCLKIRSLKDQIESFLALKVQADPSVYQPSFRVSTAKQVEPSSTSNESSRKAKEDLSKKMISPYYEPKLRIIRRFQKLRIPRSACDERSNKS